MGRLAAVARNRIKISVEQPLKALWEIIGVAGKPPKDSAKQFALIANILTGVGFVLIPSASPFSDSRNRAGLRERVPHGR